MKVEIKVKIKNLTSLTIAGGSTIGVADIPINPLLIPSSSLKGTMRTAIHNYLPKGYTSCGEIEPKRIKKAHKEGPCDVCQLFGYPDSKDGGCFTIIPNIGKVNTEYMTRVSIDDKTQKAKQGSLFVQEIIPPNNEFEFTINYFCDERLLKLLLYSILSLRYWRLGRNALIDVKVTNDICKQVKCDTDMKEILAQLSDFMW